MLGGCLLVTVIFQINSIETSATQTSVSWMSSAVLTLEIIFYVDFDQIKNINSVLVLPNFKNKGILPTPGTLLLYVRYN